jgi:mono/diheme cytochrome c family protein
MKKRMSTVKRVGLGLLVLGLIVPVLVLVSAFVAEPGSDQPAVRVANAADAVKTGEYLARAGNCMACHTAQGGARFAGGRAMPTPFGTVYTTNVTPDSDTGIGKWTADDFWGALHNGKAKDGHFLYPAFPYPSYTKVTRADSDALFAYFRTIPSVRQGNRENELRFPYNFRILIAFWRAAYFKPGEFEEDPRQTSAWNRGAYLVQGLGHCAACHAPRSTWGGTDLTANLSGGTIPVLNWYAPPLVSDGAARAQDWPVNDIADLLKTGVSNRGVVFGPMSEVVGSSLQHLSHDDIGAIAVYLKSAPVAAAMRAVPALPASSKKVLELGGKLYSEHCASCHQADGRGVERVYPALASNVSLSAGPGLNSIRIVLNGGFPPSTAGNPRPYGMPPFGPSMNDDEIAAVVSYIRTSWGNHGGIVSPVDVAKSSGVPAP